MSKKGVLTRIEEKFYGKVIANQIEVKGIWKPIVNMGVPFFIQTIDNTFGDKIPEPWQTHLEKLTTIFYEAMKDGVITTEERNHVAHYCVAVMNAEIDIPGIGEENEMVVFLGFWKFISAVIWKEVNDKVV